MANSIPEQWADQARYDLDTARAMLTSERYVYVLFCCQQAVEKMLKGVIAERTGEFPPRTHDLMRLADRAGLEPDGEQALLMRRLSEYYTQSRYPDQLSDLLPGLTREHAQDVLSQTEAVLEWLSSML